MTAPVLRGYQLRAIESLRAAIRAGARRILLTAPCGAGKTVIISTVSESFLRLSKRPVLILVHRQELVDQTLQKLASCGVRAGVIMGADKRVDASAMAQVASVPTLHRRLQSGRLPPAGLIFVDEAHHCLSRSYREVLSAYPDAIWIGLTATPVRADGQGFGDVFERLIVAETTRGLIERGFLSPFAYYALDAPALWEIPTVAGDWKRDELETAMNTRTLVGSAVKEYLALAKGRRAFVYAVGIDHSKALATEFRAAGIPSAQLDQSTPKADRARIIEDFRTGRILSLCSVGCLTEGVDVCEAEVCSLNRPTKSLSLHLQMVGRVLRVAPGKQRAIILDHGGGVFRHGFPDDPREWSLEKTHEAQVPRLMCCTACGLAIQRFPSSGKCPGCGSLQDLPTEEREASDRRRGKEQVEGKRLSRDEIQEVLDRARELGRTLTRAQALKVARATRAEKASEYLRLCQVRQAKGFAKGFVGNQFRAVFGHWPRFRKEELSEAQPANEPFLPLERRDPTTVKRGVRG
jgi:DNA repair protein RadD